MLKLLFKIYKIINSITKLQYKNVLFFIINIYIYTYTIGIIIYSPGFKC